VPTIVSGGYEWDEAKATSNADKHGVSFDEAALALDTDPNEVAVEDPDEPGRVHSLVWSMRDRVLLVVSMEARART
jgi:uncharacterized DUF497 family protein